MAGGGAPRARAWSCPEARVMDRGLSRGWSGPRRGQSLCQMPQEAEGGGEERSGSPSLHLPSAIGTPPLTEAIRTRASQGPARHSPGHADPSSADAYRAPSLRQGPRRSHGPAVRRRVARLGGALLLHMCRWLSLLVLLCLPVAVPLTPRVVRGQEDTPILDSPGGLAPFTPAELACLLSLAWPGLATSSPFPPPGLLDLTLSPLTSLQCDELPSTEDSRVPHSVLGIYPHP